MLYVICYDITKNGIRRKAANAVLDFGGRVQKSTYECDFRTEARLRVLMRRLRDIIDPVTDSVRAYRVCASCLPQRRLIGIDLAPEPLKRTIIL